MIYKNRGGVVVVIPDLKALWVIVIARIPVNAFFGIHGLYATHKLISLYIYTNKQFIPNINMEGGLTWMVRFNITAVMKLFHLICSGYEVQSLIWLRSRWAHFESEWSVRMKLLLNIFSQCKYLHDCIVGFFYVTGSNTKRNSLWNMLCALSLK